MRLRFAHPEPAAEKSRVWPVFLPYAGCVGRCVYCAQHLQTGVAPASPASPASLDTARRDLDTALAEALAAGRGPYEIGFYGGTFTALPGNHAERFITLAQTYRERGLVTRVRCSTRPDAAHAGRLAALRGLGLDMVEIGVQTFEAGVLARSGRGYAPDAAQAACLGVREAGLALGVQLLPGLPGHTPEMFARDVAKAAALGPETARIYPCLVMAGTRLAAMWRAGEYTPWDVEATVAAVAEGLLELWRAGVRVIRVGLAPQPELDAAVLAGPVHPALGSRARGLALFWLVRDQAHRLGHGPKGLVAPRRYVGELWGHGRELAQAYADLGLTRDSVRPADVTDFEIWTSEGDAPPAPP
ncbi:elongator complex protein 3 [Desulfolutivibrio sp.]|uniref:elongator complex protein 3 n=1 Tax=Desulfolutivibrio sp. TaxID=2773296 RepID=UPI002F96C3AD